MKCNLNASKLIRRNADKAKMCRIRKVAEEVSFEKNQQKWISDTFLQVNVFWGCFRNETEGVWL